MAKLLQLIKPSSLKRSWTDDMYMAAFRSICSSTKPPPPWGFLKLASWTLFMAWSWTTLWFDGAIAALSWRWTINETWLEHDAIPSPWRGPNMPFTRPLALHLASISFLIWVFFLQRGSGLFIMREQVI